MELRRQLALVVLQDGVSVSEASRLYGVTRPVVRKWVDRARQDGIADLRERSRAPLRIANKTDLERESALLALKRQYPEWGARKLVELMSREQGLSLASRTAEHILARNGLTAKRVAQPKEHSHFEREACGMLLQMDFKGMPSSARYSILTVLDDHARYCLSFTPVKDKTGESVRPVLWEMFGDHGLPAQMLMDNGDCWGTTQGLMPTKLEIWLMKLGIHPIHGRPGHPQTQGKVERFHLTAKIELKESLVQPDIEQARKVYAGFVERYNWVRPHDSLAGKTPGQLYRPFGVKRPDKIAEPYIPEGAVTRKVNEYGIAAFQGKRYKIGKGLIGETVILKETDQGWIVSFNGFDLAPLDHLPHG